MADENYFANIELVLSLPLKAKAVYERQLSRTPVLKNCNAVHLACEMHYFDAAPHPLRQSQVEIQSLKSAGWDGFHLKRKRIRGLQPCFAMQFDRTRWTVKAPDGSRVQVSLDDGHIRAGTKTTRMCELVLLLLDGAPGSLWDVAYELAHSVSGLPVIATKAQRKYLLSQGNLLEPVRPNPVKLNKGMEMPEIIKRVLTEMLGQFTQNLIVLRRSMDPEVVHQARVGWRRFKSALHVFEKTAYLDHMPPLEGLDFVLARLSDLRELDVAKAYTASWVEHARTPVATDKVERWSQLEQRLVRERLHRQAQVSAALDQPIVGATILNIYNWLAVGIVSGTPPESNPYPSNAGRVLKRRITHLYDQLKARPRHTIDSAAQHRTRILSKRLRYGVEALRTLLPPKQVKIWHRKALRLQTEIGLSRDVFTVMEIMASLFEFDGAP